MRAPRLLALVLALVVLALGACATLHAVNLEPDYGTWDRTQTIRLVVFTSPLPEGGEKVARLVGEIARAYANDHRDFIVKAARDGESAPADLCAKGVEGVLRLTPSLKRRGAGVEAEVRAVLTRCRDGATIWSAEAGGTFPSDDPSLKDTTDHYAQSLGPEVRPYVAPVFVLLKATLDALPKPKLPDDDAVMEKIQLGG